MGNKHDIYNKTNRNENDIKSKDIDINISSKKIIYKSNIVFVGEKGTGTKTSLIKRIKEGKYIGNIDTYKEIIEKIIYEKDNKEFILYLIDTDTGKEKTNLTLKNNENYEYTNYYKNADFIIMGYDVTNKQSFEEIKSFWYDKIKENTQTNSIYLLGNKIDLQKNIKVDLNDVNNFSVSHKIKHFSISVKNGKNIQNFIDDLQFNISNIYNKNI